MNFDDTDSEEDEAMNYSPFGNNTAADRRKQRTLDKKVSKGFSILDQAVLRADQMKESDDKIATLKKDYQLVVTPSTTAAAAAVDATTNDKDKDQDNKDKAKPVPKGRTCKATTTTTKKKKHSRTSDPKKTPEELAHDAFMAGIENTITTNRSRSQAAPTGKDQPINEAHAREHRIAGIFEDLENILSPKLRLALGRAKDTEVSSTLGARSIISFDPYRSSSSLSNIVGGGTNAAENENDNDKDNDDNDDDDESTPLYFAIAPKTTNNSGNQRSRNCKHAKSVTTATATPTPTTSIATTADYILQLKDILRKLVSPDQRILQTAWIQPLRQQMKHVFSLQQFLQGRQLARSRHEHQLLQIPEEIMVWLLRVACSADGDNSDHADNKGSVVVPLRHGAMETLQALLQSNQVLAAKTASKSNNSDDVAMDENNETIVTDGTDESEQDESTTIAKPDFLALSQMAVQLLSWVPLATPYANKDKETSSLHDGKENNTNHLDRINPLGLERFFSIWCTAFETDQVSVPTTSTGVGVEGAKDATRCLVLLVKAGLDDRLRSTESNFRLVKHLKCIISKLLELVQRQVFSDDEKLYLDWIGTSSKAIVDELVRSKLGPGEKDREDATDDLAYGSFARACWVLPMMARTHRAKTDCRFQKSALQFKAVYCLQTLEQFFISTTTSKGKFDCWSDEVYAVVAECQKESKVNCDFVAKAKESLRWRVLCSCLAALVKLNDLGITIHDHECKLLATLQIALGRCLEVGMEFYKDDAIAGDNDDDAEQSKSGKKNEFTTKEEAHDMACLLGLLRTQCTDLSSKTGSSLMNPYFTRAGYLIQCHIKYFDETKQRAAKLGGERSIVQGSLGSWLKKSPTATKSGVKGGTPRSEGNDSDDSDESGESPRKKMRPVLAEKVS